MKKDCSNILVYKEEIKRMCKHFGDCSACNLEECTCDEINDITPKHIETVQKWSDEHPVKTRQSELLKIFPNASLRCDGTVDICPSVFDVDIECNTTTNCDKCRQEFWSQEVE